jgi:hypothetical protein
MDVVRQQVTADELLHMPDDGFRYELVRGELRRTTPAGNVHGRVAAKFAWRLARLVEENRLGTVYAAETGFRLGTDPDTVRAPVDEAFEQNYGSILSAKAGRKLAVDIGTAKRALDSVKDLCVQVDRGLVAGGFVRAASVSRPSR